MYAVRMSPTELAKSSKLRLSYEMASTFLLATAFVWYLCAFEFLQNVSSAVYSSSQSLIVITVNFIAFAFAAFVGSNLSQVCNNRKTILKFWIIGGILISLLFGILDFADYSIIVFLSILVGAYFGLGMPTFLGYFKANTTSTNRGKFGGFTVLLIVLSIATINIIAGSQTFILSSILAAWLAIGLTCILHVNQPEKIDELKQKVSFKSVISNKTFILFIIPWLMLSLINDLTMQINANYFNNLQLSNYFIIENVLAGFSAVVCGFLADRQGRKRLALMGFALLGLGYAALGLFSGNSLAAWFYICVDGIAWGSFTALFLITVWGDIAQDKSSEKYYVLGVLPYLFSTFAGSTLGAYMSQVVSETTVFSFAAFFLFSATLPLFYAPETLSEKVLKDMDLMSYVEKAKKKAASETKKKKTETKEDAEEPKAPEDDSNYEEAKKLAEKYY
jgi:MFS family permease